MRNLKQYPITADEVHRELHKLQESFSENSPISSIGPLIRNYIQTFFSIKENMNNLIEYMRIK